MYIFLIAHFLFIFRFVSFVAVRIYFGFIYFSILSEKMQTVEIARLRPPLGEIFNQKDFTEPTKFKGIISAVLKCKECRQRFTAEPFKPLF